MNLFSARPIIIGMMLEELIKPIYVCGACGARFSWLQSVIATEQDDEGEEWNVYGCPTCGSEDYEQIASESSTPPSGAISSIETTGI
jgi:DNA-directed RNA polymerase subunit RPC12/RpoP